MYPLAFSWFEARRHTDATIHFTKGRKMVLPTRIELVFYPYQGYVMPLYYESNLEQDTRIELVTGRWQRSVLPLN